MRRPRVLPDLRVGSWLGAGFGAAAILLVAVVAVALALLGRIAAAERHQSEGVVPRAAAVDEAEVELLRLGIAARARVIAGDERSLAAFQRVRARSREAREALAARAAATDGPLLAAALPALAAYEAAADEMVAHAARGARDEAAAAELRLAERREEAVARLRAYADVVDREAAEAGAAIREAQRRAGRALVAATALVLAVLAATSVLVVRGIREPVRDLVDASRRLAAGDHAAAAALASPPGGAGAPRNELAELGGAFGRMALELRDREERIVAQNEELQAQQEELQAQNEELQAQQEELQAQNEELQVQTRELADRSDALHAREERLRASEERYRHLFVHLSEGFALHEIVREPGGAPSDYRFLEVNPAFERLTGVSRERIVGHTAREFVPGAAPEWLERYAEVARTGRPVRFEARAAAVDKWFEVVAFRPEERQVAVLVFDVTERRVAHEVLREADRRKEEFIAVLSHELRNPLAPIVNGLHLLDRSDPASDAGRRAREVIGRQVAHLGRLVDDLLDVTRIRSGKVRLRRVPVELGAVARHSAEDHASILAAQGVALEVRAPAREVWVNADPARIAQVIGNLLQNAAKFTPAGGRVELAVEVADGGLAVVRVRDSGIGIPVDVLPTLFQPFAQAERSLARTRGGLGLGLALVKGLVELHGGRVSATSEGEGRGAEFAIELPLVAAADGDAAQHAPRGRIAPRRVLVVEDNADAADSLAELLRLFGHDVEVARDGDEGVRLARALVPDVVLCDIGLPGTDGYEVARRLRADPNLAGTQLVALTGYALADDLRRARDAGFDAHLTKPSRPEDVQAVLAGGRQGLYGVRGAG